MQGLSLGTEKIKKGIQGLRGFRRPGEMAWSQCQYNKIITCRPVSPKSCTSLFPQFTSLHSPRKNQSPSLPCSIFSVSQNTVLKLPSPALCVFSPIKIFWMFLSSAKPLHLRFTSHHTPRGNTAAEVVPRLFYFFFFFFASRDSSLYFCHILHFHPQRLCHVVGNIGKEKNCIIVIFCPLSIELLWCWKEMRYHDRVLVLEIHFPWKFKKKKKRVRGKIFLIQQLKYKLVRNVLLNFSG